MASIAGRAIIVTKTNKSGGALAKGDVVVVDSANDNAVTTTTTSGTTVTVGVVVEENGIANNASGRVQFGGHVSLVTVNASVTRGHYGYTHTVAKQAADAGTSRIVGTFCYFTTGGTTPEADLFSQPDASSASGNVATDAIWDAAGDLAVGTGANTAAKLTIGSAYKTLRSNGTTAIWDGFHGARAYASATQTVGSGAAAPLTTDTEKYDTDAYHFTSDAALTGTVAKTATSADIVGTGTSFTSELSVNQVISIPGTATEIGVVKTITDNTHITLWQTMANSASGQTATRRSNFWAIPAGLGGYYFMYGNCRWATVTTAKVSHGSIGLNGSLTATGTVLAIQGQQSVTSSANIVNCACEYPLIPGDYVAFYLSNSESGTVTVNNSAEYGAMFGLSLRGV